MWLLNKRKSDEHKESRNKRVKWMPNDAGWRLYGHINLLCGCPVYFIFGEPTDMPNPPDDATAAQARNMAKTIRLRLLESDGRAERMKLLIQRTKGLFAGGPEDMRQYVASYASFLDNCQGYRLLF